MIIYVDIDKTICDDTYGEYHKAKPIHARIDKINKLYDSGHTIVYWTARGALSGIDWFYITKKQLIDWGCKFDELIDDKPAYDILIDDKAITRVEDVDYVIHS